MSTFVYEGGRGGQKSPKNCPRGLCLTPKYIHTTYKHKKYLVAKYTKSSLYKKRIKKLS